MMVIMMSHIIMAIIFIVVNYLNGTTFTLLFSRVKVDLNLLVKQTVLTNHIRIVLIYEKSFDFPGKILGY